MLPTVALLAALSMEFIGQPVRAKNILAVLVAVDPKTGKEVLVLSNNNEGSGGELIFVDLENGSGTVFKTPAGAGAEGLTQVPDGRLVLGTFYDGHVMVFDMKKMAFDTWQRFGNETYVWGFAVGNDGRAYFGTFPGGKLGALDLNSYTFEDLGAAAPPNFYLRAVVGNDDGRIFCHFIVEKPTWLLFDPRTRTFASLPAEIQRAPYLSVWNGYLLTPNRAFDGRTFEAVPLPFKVPALRSRPATPAPLNNNWSLDPILTTHDVLYVEQGDYVWRLAKDEKAFRLISSIDFRGGRLQAELSDGRLVGIRGQDYFIIKPGDTAVNLKPILGESAPRGIFFLKSDPKGRLWGGPPFGQTLFVIDPQVGTVVNTPTISDRTGEVYDVAFLDGVTYAAAYNAGEVIRYDPEKPWDQWNRMNPKTLVTLRPRGFVRPTGGIIVGPGRKLYSGWTAGIGYGGAIAITDPDRGETDLITNPLGQQAIMGVATDGNLLYVGTGLGGTGLPNQAGQSATFGIIDPATRSVVYQETLAGTGRVRVIGYDAATKIVVTSVDTSLRLFDTVTRTFIARGQDAPRVASFGNAIPGDGRFYFTSAKQALLMDLRTGVVQTLGEAPVYVDNIALAPDGTVYVSGGVNLYAIRPRFY
jgi:hypothetical protein